MFTALTFNEAMTLHEKLVSAYSKLCTQAEALVAQLDAGIPGPAYHLWDDTADEAFNLSFEVMDAATAQLAGR